MEETLKRQEFIAGTVQLATRIPKGLHLRVRVHALDVGRTMADFVGEALTEHLDRCQGNRKGSKRGKGRPSDAA